MSNDLFNKLDAQEKGFLSQNFLAPVLKYNPVKVRIAGIVSSLTLVRKTYEGWGVFKPISFKEARFIRAADIAERQQYLNLFPRLFLILCQKIDNVWLGTPANQSDTRFKITGLVPVRLPEEVQMFETVQARFDGAHCWFDCVDSKNPQSPIYLRDELVKLTDPSKIPFAFSSPEYQTAYNIAYSIAMEADLESKRDKQEERIKRALEIGGAKYHSYIDRGRSYTIEFSIGKDRHKSTVNKETLQVESAGICLNGTDARFDLTSLISVMKEGERKRLIVRVGDNRQERDSDDDSGDSDW